MLNFGGHFLKIGILKLRHGRKNPSSLWPKDLNQERIFLRPVLAATEGAWSLISFVFHKEIYFIAIYGGLRVQCWTEGEGVKNRRGQKWAWSKGAEAKSGRGLSRVLSQSRIRKIYVSHNYYFYGNAPRLTISSFCLSRNNQE